MDTSKNKRPKQQSYELINATQKKNKGVLGVVGGEVYQLSGRKGAMEMLVRNSCACACMKTQVEIMNGRASCMDR